MNKTDQLNQDFVTAVKRSDMKTAKFLLLAGADVDTQGTHVLGVTALWHAVKNKRPDFVELLIRKGANVDKGGYDTNLNGDPGNPLCLSTCYSLSITTNMLLDAGADVNLSGVRGWTPLLYATRTPEISLMRRLIKLGADINVEMHDGWTPLMIAALNGYFDAAKVLIEAGANPFIKNADGDTARNVASPKKEALYAVKDLTRRRGKVIGYLNDVMMRQRKKCMEHERTCIILKDYIEGRNAI